MTKGKVNTMIGKILAIHVILLSFPYFKVLCGGRLFAQSRVLNNTRGATEKHSSSGLFGHTFIIRIHDSFNAQMKDRMQSGNA